MRQPARPDRGPRPEAPRSRPATAVHPLHALQTRAGNAATVAAVQREEEKQGWSLDADTLEASFEEKDTVAHGSARARAVVADALAARRDELGARLAAAKDPAVQHALREALGEVEAAAARVDDATTVGLRAIADDLRLGVDVAATGATAEATTSFGADGLSVGDVATTQTRLGQGD